MQVQSHVRLHPQIFCGYTNCCDAWGPGRRLTGASLLNMGLSQDDGPSKLTAPPSAYGSKKPFP